MKINLFKLFCFLFILILFPANSYSKDFTVIGRVINADTKEPVIAASVKVLESAMGTYTNNKGYFRINLWKTAYKFAISSIGYKKTIIDISSDYNGDTILVVLPVSEIVSKEAVIYGQIKPEEIIKRAIAKKNENNNRIKTVSASIYTKLFTDIGGNLGSSIFSDDQSTGISLSSKKDDRMPSTFLMENFSQFYKDVDQGINHSTILQRRQTKNLSAIANQFVMNEFINFMDNEVLFFDTHMKTPLCDDALDYYNFSLINKSFSDDKYIYHLSINPKSSIAPGFEGTISILEGTYELIGLNLRPTSNTAIQFIDSLNFIQKYSNISKNIWYPTYLEVNGKAELNLISGLQNAKLDLKAVSIINQIEINQKLPDSIYVYKDKRSVDIDVTADSVKKEFWDKNALFDLSEFEKNVYNVVDSLALKRKKTDSLADSPVKFNFDPYIDFNRVGSISFGLSPIVKFFGLPIKGHMYYSTGQKEFYGDMNIEMKGKLSNQMLFSFDFNVFSKIESMGFDKSYSRIYNTFATALFHEDYYDYLQKDGMDFGIGIKYYSLFDIKFTYENSRQFALKKTTNRTIFSNSNLRDNPEAFKANYSVFSLDINLGKDNDNNIEGDFNYYWKTKAFYGEFVGISYLFKGVESVLDVYIPLIKTGYKPIAFNVIGVGGYSDDKMPAQYQFRMKTSLAIIGKFGNFYTAAPAEFGGMRYFEVHGKFDFQDYFWRVIGLPLYEGRGINFELYASTGQYYGSQKSVIYKSTEEKYYTEFGFGFSKLPTFFSNVFYWEFQCRWGIGPVAAGRFGWAVGLSLPF